MYYKTMLGVIMNEKVIRTVEIAKSVKVPECKHED